MKRFLMSLPATAVAMVLASMARAAESIIILDVMPRGHAWGWFNAEGIIILDALRRAVGLY